MALINCPECARVISDMAVSCPGCGYPICNGHTPLPGNSSKKSNAILEEELKTLIEQKGKMAAIKYYKQATNQDLKNSVDYINNLIASHGLRPKQSGCAGAIILLALLSAVVILCIIYYMQKK